MAKSVRTLAVVVALAAALVTVLGPQPAAAGSGPSAASDRAAIRRAFAVLGDVDEPVARRAAMLERGSELRGVLRALSRPGATAAGISLDGVSLVIDRIRLHGNRAEVLFAPRVGLTMPAGSFYGLALRRGDRWVVANTSFCQVLDFTAVRCPASSRLRYPNDAGGAADMRTESGETVVAVVFGEGTSADVVLPAGVPTAGWRVRPQAAIGLGETRVNVWFGNGDLGSLQIAAWYPGPDDTRVPLDVMRGLVVKAGAWTAFVGVEELSERERTQVAANLRVVVRDGFPVLEPSLPLAFFEIGAAARPAKSSLSIDPAGLPIELTNINEESQITVAVTLGECNPAWYRQWTPFVSGDYMYGQRCIPGAQLGVEGTDLAALDRLWRGVRIRNVVRPAPSVTS